MARNTSELTDEPWEKIAPLLPEPQASPWGGRKPIPNRPCFEGLLWILRTGARCHVSAPHGSSTTRRATRTPGGSGWPHAGST